MRAEVIINGEPVDRFEFAVAPRAGDSLLYKGNTLKVDEFRHNLDQNRLQVLCSGTVKAAPKAAPAASTPNRQQPARPAPAEPKKEE